jgi:hypothetical protein
MKVPHKLKMFRTGTLTKASAMCLHTSRTSPISKLCIRPAGEHECCSRPRIADEIVHARPGSSLQPSPIKPSPHVWPAVGDMSAMGAGTAAASTRAWLDILRGAWMVLAAAPAPSEVVAMVRESKKGQEEEEELAWLEALAGCLGAAVALARGQDDIESQVGGSVDKLQDRDASLGVQGA